jgi:hypothetical protein
MQVILTAAERQKLWKWCPDFIDREAIYRGMRAQGHTVGLS